MTDDLFTLPAEFVENMRNAMSDEQVELPFPAPVVWWKNGDKRQKATGGVLYHGGWAISADTLDTLNLDTPAGFVAETWINRDGGEYNVLSCRSFGFAVIAKRRQWTQNEAGNSRSHVQVLGIMALYDKGAKKYNIYGPVVLSAKGLAGRSLEDAFKKWDKSTLPSRKQYANGYPAWFFYAPIGTFGNEPVFEQWGGAQKSSGTPVQVFVPELVTDEHLRAWFVGADTAAMMNEFKSQAKDWLNAWAKKDNAAPADPATPPALAEDFPF
jgi:hypothetical protein